MDERAEQALRDALAFAESVVDTMLDPLLVLDGDLRVVSAGREFYRTFGVTKEETEGWLIYELGNRQWDIPGLRTLLEDVLPRNTSFRDYEVEHVFEGIGRKVMLLNARTLYRVGNGSRRILLVIEDATERRDAEEARRAAEDRFTEMVKNVRDHSIFLTDPAGVITSWNVAAERVVGYSEAEAVGRHFSLIFTPEDLENGLPEWELRTAREQGRAEDERWHRRKDGTRFWALGIVTPLHDAGGRLTGFSKILRDITDRKRADEALRGSEERLRVALAAGEMGTWLWRIPTDEQVLDDGLRRLMGLPAGQDVMTMEHFLHTVHPDDRGHVREAFDRCLRERGNLNVEFRVTWPDGSVHWLRDQGKVFPGEDGRPLLLAGAVMDITGRKRMEEELRQADRRKDEFLAMLGHELRNPLAPLRGVMETLRRQQLDGDGLGRAYAMTERQVGHLTRLVDDLLDVSRITRGLVEIRKEPVNLGDVVDQAVEMASPAVEGRGHELSFTLPRKALRVEGDATRLTQVVFNLLNNAAKYTDPGGRIWLTVDREGEEAVVRVRDNGSGMKADLVPRVFDLFTQGERTLDRSQGGLGLGLSLVKRLVEMHGGTVTARSEGPGRGSEFTVRLPALPAEADKPPPARVMGPPRATLEEVVMSAAAGG